jgi:hypothetical protein
MTGATRGPLVLEGGQLRVTVDPALGGTITAIEHLGLGASVLGRTPWEAAPAPADSTLALDEESWLRHYGGGWPILFPNGGDACRYAGIAHGFHGEASVAPWQAEIDKPRLRLARRFVTAPVEMRRELTVEGERLTIRERLRMLGPHPVEVMWGHHPTFGSDLLDGPFAIETGARRVTVDDRYDPASNPLQPGAEGLWPTVPGKHGAFDLSRPAGRIAALAYLQDFESAWAGIRRLDDSLAAVLSWDSSVFSCAWLWYELGGTEEPPWCGKARLIGVEPNATWPGNGLADAARRGGRLLALQPGAEIETWIRLCVFKPRGPVLGIDAHGHALSSPASR